MRAAFTGLAVTAGILAICMGAGEADMRAGAFVLAIISGLCAAASEAA